MTVWQRIWRSNFSIKLRHWEYWPFGIVQLPAIVYYAWLSLRARSFLFFTASNPGIEMGGMFGESKIAILDKIPEAIKAKTVFISRGTSPEQVIETIANNGLHFPVVFKPDLGERGYRVKRIYTEAQVQEYVRTFRFDFLVQELIDLPLEFGVFYKRLPSQKNGVVFSIVGKEMLSVTGTGAHTLQQLIINHDRAKLQWQKLKPQHEHRLHEKIIRGERVLLNPIGNHCLGTMFLNSNHLISDTLNKSFDRISQQIEGFYYGRFDLRTASVEDLRQGRVKIMELNGCGAEPAHVYQPGYSFWKAAVEMLQHWKNIFDIAMENKKRGHAFLTYREARAYYQKFKEAVKP
jgi:hypothetical protein